MPSQGHARFAVRDVARYRLRRQNTRGRWLALPIRAPGRLTSAPTGAAFVARATRHRLVIRNFAAPSETTPTRCRAAPRPRPGYLIRPRRSHEITRPCDSHGRGRQTQEWRRTRLRNRPTDDVFRGP